MSVSMVLHSFGICTLHVWFAHSYPSNFCTISLWAKPEIFPVRAIFFSSSEMDLVFQSAFSCYVKADVLQGGFKSGLANPNFIRKEERN